MLAAILAADSGKSPSMRIWPFSEEIRTELRPRTPT
jgi:hypothetical protein